jgi:hypothetical protein
MTPESIVVSLEWAKKLKEAGYPKDDCSHYYSDTRKSWKPYNCDHLGEFVPFENGDLEVTWGIIELHHSRDDAVQAAKGYNNSEPLAAPTAEEIMRALPDWIYCKKSSFGPAGRWMCAEKEGHVRVPKGFHSLFECDSLSNAVAAMWCYLKEQNLL